MKPIRAFILAAGYGERLRPITDHIPKPLLPVLGKPVIEIVLERIARLPVDSFGINLHHKAGMLFKWLNTSQYIDKIELFHEHTILGTGGALKNASGFLCRSAFIVHNADILSDINLELLVNNHFFFGNTVTLAVHNYEKFNNIWIDKSGNLQKVGKAETEQSSRLCKIAFTGIAVYSPEFLDYLPEGVSSVVDAWLYALASGKKIGTVDFTGCSWTDIGTPDAYATAVFEELAKTGETIYVHPSADCGKAEIKGRAVFESRCVTGTGTYLKDCIVLPDAHIQDGNRIEDAVAGPDYIIGLEKRKSEPAPISGDLAGRFFQRPVKDLESGLIGTGGSDRKYYRLDYKEKTAVLMVCTSDDPDYERHIAYTEFFTRHSLPVPDMYAADREQKQALFEDLGDLSLYAWLKCRRAPERIEAIYRRVLDILVMLHTTLSGKVAECPLLACRVFDYEHLRWETGYFADMFVSGLTGMTIKDERKLNEDFHVLAKTAASHHKGIVHRDFQSQNLMIAKDEVPRVIDYQGARIGPPAYDLASVLWDPYYRLQGDIRKRLLHYYIKKMKAGRPDTFNEEAFRHSLLLCRLQRHMQALGAYGFLSKVKGKTYFLKYIPEALSYLTEETTLAKDDYPALHELVMELNSVCKRDR